MTATKKTMLALGALTLLTLAVGAGMASAGVEACPASCPKDVPCEPCPCPGC